MINLKPLIESLSLWTSHTIAYYRTILSVKSVRMLLVCLLLLILVTGTITAQAAVPASVAKWLIGDAIHKEYIAESDSVKYYQFILLDDEVESSYRFKLNMPQTVAEYIEDISLYKMEEGLSLALRGEYIKPDEIVMWSESDNSEAMEKVGQFIDGRPPKVVVE